MSLDDIRKSTDNTTGDTHEHVYDKNGHLIFHAVNSPNGNSYTKTYRPGQLVSSVNHHLLPELPTPGNYSALSHEAITITPYAHLPNVERIDGKTGIITLKDPKLTMICTHNCTADEAGELSGITKASLSSSVEQDHSFFHTAQGKKKRSIRC